MTFETFERRYGMARGAVTISFRKDGSVSLSGAAYGLLDRPSYVLFLLGRDEDEGKVLVQPSDAVGEPGAYQVQVPTDADHSVYVNARDLTDELRKAGVLEEGVTHVWPMAKTSNVNGRLTVMADLTLPGTVRTSGRAGKKRKPTAEPAEEWPAVRPDAEKPSAEEA